MEQYSEIIATLALMFGIGFGSGISVYLTIVVLGLMNMSGTIILPESLSIISNPVVLFAASAMYFLEFIADKIPGIDSAWDSIHSFIRIPIGAILVWGAAGVDKDTIEVAAAILGVGVTTFTHTAKSGGRLLVNTSPEPASNIFISVSEDIAVVVALFAAIKNPILFFVLFIAFIFFLIWFVPKIFKGVRRIFAVLLSVITKSKNAHKNDSRHY